MSNPVRNRRRGSTLIEFTLTGIPILFLTISIVECSIAMCEYESMINAVTIAARYAANHGANCQSPNTCTIRIEDIANLIATTAWIITPSSMTVTFTDNTGPTTCTLSTCQTNTAQFPSSTSSANAVGNPITIKVSHRLTNPMPMYWPPHVDTDDAGYTLSASSKQVIQF
jgi:Flp pilus assembly protein TadG